MNIDHLKQNYLRDLLSLKSTCKQENWSFMKFNDKINKLNNKYYKLIQDEKKI